VSPSEDVIDDILLLSEGTFEQPVQAARLAVTDWRDLKLAAERLRGS
jgi:hypothetical protein